MSPVRGAGEGGGEEDLGEEAVGDRVAGYLADDEGAEAGWSTGTMRDAGTRQPATVAKSRVARRMRIGSSMIQRRVRFGISSLEAADMPGDRAQKSLRDAEHTDGVPLLRNSRPRLHPVASVAAGDGGAGGG